MDGMGMPIPLLAVTLEQDAAHAGTSVRAAIQVTFGQQWHVNAHKTGDDYLIPTDLKLDAVAGFSVREVAYPEPAPIALEGTNETIPAYGPVVLIGTVFDIAADVVPGDYTVTGTLQYQACDMKQCYPPNELPVTIPIKVVPAGQALTATPADVFQRIHFTGAPDTHGPSPAPAPAVAPPAEPGTPVSPGDWRPLMDAFTVAGEASGYVGPSDFLAFLEAAASGRPVEDTAFSGKAGWLVALLAIAGGLLLNLTPCVLPLIPINIAIIGAGTKAGSRSRGFLLGGAYGAGIALAYGILGLVVILGVSSTFGAINATPWFNAAIAVVFVALALAMFDVYLIDFTRFQTRLGIGKREGSRFATAFLMGVVSALLAGACVAPIVISSIVYAQDRYANGVTLALALPFLVGIGMGLPWPLAGAGLSFLPKPGAWMVRVKQAFGVLILLFAAYYAHLAYGLVRAQQAGGETAAAGWNASLAEGLAQAQREKKPVLIDFWATWCKNCTMMDATTFRQPEVQARISDYVKVRFQAEHPGDPTTRDVMRHFQIVGMPTLVVLRPK